MTVVRALKDLNMDWLTETLRSHGVLEHGRVLRVKQQGTKHFSLLNYFLAVRYSADAPKTAPKTLFLKLSRPDRLPLTADEVHYYTKILAQMPYRVAPTCYSAEYDPEVGAYHILMEDVSATHATLPYQFPPSPQQAVSMARTLAKFHAFWWAKPTLNTVSNLPSEAVIQRYVEKCLGGLAPMFDYLGDRLTSDQKRQIEQLTARYPSWLLTRVQQTPNHLTLIHGDSHNANFLLPNTDGDTYLIDRQPFEWSLTCSLGVSDLTYMMVHWWYPAYRQRIEESVLRAYHDELCLHGVTNYTWEQLWNDYRLCAVQSLYAPLAWCALEPAEKFASEWYPLLMHTLVALGQLHAGDALTQVTGGS